MTIAEVLMTRGVEHHPASFNGAAIMTIAEELPRLVLVELGDPASMGPRS